MNSVSLNNIISNTKLQDFNNINIIYNISNKEVNNLLIKIKTLFGINFKLLVVKKGIDKRNNIISLNKQKINKSLSQKSIDNIFHTYNDDIGYISYNKYKTSIVNIVREENNLIIIENNNVIPICESYNIISSSYLEYLFKLENNINISIEYYLENKYNLKIEIPIIEEKYITDDKLDYINDIYNKINTIIYE
jgi:hypothetical protein